MAQSIFSDKSFTQLGIHPRIVDRLEKEAPSGFGFKHATNAQKLGIAPQVAERDLILKSETGSGKTMTFLIPLINKLMNKTRKIDRKQGTYAIILSPTRELALQIFNVLDKLTKPIPFIVPGIVAGGEKKKSEKARLRKGVTVLVATPGRLLDHLQTTAAFATRNLDTLILDEADRLLDMGFNKQITEIVEKLHEKSLSKEETKFQTVLTSATMTQEIERLARITLKNPAFVDADKDYSGTVEEYFASGVDKQAAKSSTMPKRLVQHLAVLPCKWRLIGLIAFLREQILGRKSKVLVFFSSCDSVDFHFQLLGNEKSVDELRAKSKKSTKEEDEDALKKQDELDDDDSNEHVDAPQVAAKKEKMGVHKTGDLAGSVFRIHGNMKQSERVEAYSEFVKAKKGALFCTDVAARGLDLPVVQWIIQFDAPTEVSEYVHRVGRTARVGKGGNALLCLMPHEMNYIKELEAQGIALKPFKMDPILRKLPFADPKNVRVRPHIPKEEFSYERFGRELQRRLEFAVMDQPIMNHRARQAFQSYVKGYATYPKQLKYIFHPKALHLGQVAKSFALKEQPKLLSKRLIDHDAAKNAAKYIKMTGNVGNFSHKASPNGQDLNELASETDKERNESMRIAKSIISKGSSNRPTRFDGNNNNNNNHNHNNNNRSSYNNNNNNNKRQAPSNSTGGPQRKKARFGGNTNAGSNADPFSFNAV